MRPLNFLVLIAGLIAISGCARVSVNTKLDADGGFTRTVKYAVTKNDAAGGIPGAPSKPSDIFGVPKAGAGVTVEEKTDKDSIVATVTRKVVAGSEALNDIVLLDDKKKPIVSSTVSVRKLENGRLEYTETLHWTGEHKKGAFDMPPDFRAIVKKSLPTRFQTTETIDKVARRTMKETIHILFGPSDPLFSNFLMNQDVMTHKLGSAMFRVLVPALQDEAQGMTSDEAEGVVRALVPALNATELMKDKANPTPPTGPTPDSPKSDTASLVPLTFDVSFPGHVVETNGIMDPMSGQVYWSLYALVAEFEDVKLRVVVDPAH